MKTGLKYIKAKVLLLNFLASLQGKARFQVALFADGNRMYNSTYEWQAPTKSAWAGVKGWLEDRDQYPDGASDPRITFQTIFKEGRLQPRPDVVFFVTDGDFSYSDRNRGESVRLTTPQVAFDLPSDLPVFQIKAIAPINTFGFLNIRELKTMVPASSNQLITF